MTSTRTRIGLSTRQGAATSDGALTDYDDPNTAATREL
jgi:hypothetical protein